MAATYDAARIEAEQATNMKTQLLSKMSHELRTPLNAVLGFAQLLALEDLTPEQRSSLIQIEVAGRHLLDLLSEVLDIARIEAGRMRLSIDPVEAIVLADEQRLQQVLLNLLSNAIKYNREGGRVSVFLEEGDGESAIRVTVTGEGIAAEDLPRLFVAFERLGVDDSAGQGTGMGLMLCRGLAEAMGGRMEVESTPGVGSVSSVILRTGPDLPDPDPDHDEGEVATGPESTGTIRVLYIEGNPAHQVLMRAICRQLEVPRLIFLDVHLPDLTGPEVLTRLRQEAGTVEVPIVLLTADFSAALRAQVRQLGATELLAKPLSVARFLARLDDPDRRRPTVVQEVVSPCCA